MYSAPTSVDHLGVRSVLEARRLQGVGRVKVVGPVLNNPYSSRLSSGIVSVVTSRAGAVDVLVKCGLIGEHTDVGSAWGVSHESLIYRQVLPLMSSYSSPYLGDIVIGERHWLFLRWLEGVVRVNKHPDGRAMVRTAAWLGRFHSDAVEALGQLSTSPAHRYSDGVVGGWVQLAVSNMRRVGLGSATDRLRVSDLLPIVEALLGSELTLVHGDFYPSNVLVDNVQVVPIDWEWAGLAAGELDLAALLAGWPEDVVDQCTDAYRGERWPGHLGGDVASRFWAARYFLACRGLGRRSLRASDPDIERCLHTIDIAGRRLIGSSE